MTTSEIVGLVLGSSVIAAIVSAVVTSAMQFVTHKYQQRKDRREAYFPQLDSFRAQLAGVKSMNTADMITLPMKSEKEAGDFVMQTFGESTEAYSTCAAIFESNKHLLDRRQRQAIETVSVACQVLFTVLQQQLSALSTTSKENEAEERMKVAKGLTQLVRLTQTFIRQVKSAVDDELERIKL
jgi:hypothetical protein